MSDKPLISVIIATARKSIGALIHLPSEHLMLKTFQSLEAQTFKDFEVVVVDSLFDKRRLTNEIFTLGNWSFKWKVVRPNSWWLDKGLWALQNAFNSGAVASRGKHLLFCGDCGHFDKDALERSAKLIEKGLHPHFTCFRTIKGEIVDFSKSPVSPIQDAKSVQNILNTPNWNAAALQSDTRLFCGPMVEKGSILPKEASWQWFYGYGFISRDDFFSVNGWSELYDGDKALGDVEMGSRLEQCGRMHFYMERTLAVYEELHYPTELTDGTVFRSNYDLIWLHRMHSISRAHQVRFTDSDLWRVVRGTITGIQMWDLRNRQLTTHEEVLRKHWMENQPVFVLQDHTAGSA